MKDMKMVLAEVERVLVSGRVNVEGVWQYEDLPVICVSIPSGDWKHDHLRADWLIKEMGGAPIGQEITWEDGSDCYGSIHRYVMA